MQGNGLSRVIAPLVALVLFAAMAAEATTFRETAMWFPLYTGIAGTAISLLAVIAGVVSLQKRRVAAGSRQQARSELAVAEVPVPEPGGPGGPGAEEPAPGILAGFRWLLLWAGYAVTVLVIGFIPASVLWVVIWFRTVVRWSWVRVLIAAVVVATALLVAENLLNMGMPAGWGVLGALLF